MSAPTPLDARARGGGLLERAVQARWPVAAALVLLLCVVWQAAGAAALLPDYIFTPTAIAAAFFRALPDRLPGETLATLRRQLPGFLLGTTLGVLIGLWAGMFRAVDDLTSPLVSLTYPLPKIALFPVLVVWLGFGDAPRIAIVALACLYPALVNAAAAARGIDRRKIWVARNYGAGSFRIFRQVVMRDAAGLVIVGVRIALALSFVVVFSTEAISARSGLGALIMDGYQNVQYDDMYAGMVTLGLLGFLADRLLLWASAPLVRGQQLRAIGRG